MSKTTVPLRAGDGSTIQHVAESLPGGKHMLQHVATAMRTILGYGFASVTTVVGLPNIPAGATHAYITVEGNALRWRSDGTSPAATPSTNANAGLKIPADAAAEIALADLSQVKIVAVTGTATVVVEYAKLDA